MTHYTSHYISSLDKDELIDLFREKCPLTIKQFCEINDINRANFSRFLNRKREGYGFYRIISNYLIDTLCKDNGCCRIVTYEQCMVSLIKRFMKPLSTLIFVDGDNMSESIPILQKMFFEENINESVHVICGVVCGYSHARSILDMKSESWFTCFKTSTCANNAVDVLLNTFIMISHISLSINIQFVILSSDGCFDETLSQCKPRLSSRLSMENLTYETLSEKLNTVTFVEGYSSSHEKLLDLLL